MADVKKKKAVWAEVTCDRHGKQMANAIWKSKQVKVPVPRNKREKMSGCPECKTEQNNN